MRSIDTNVVIRWLTRDDPGQAVLAAEVITTPVFIPLTVLIEVVWVLRRSYRFDRAMVNAAVTLLLDLETVTVAGGAGVRWALDRHARGADLPDMLHLVASRGSASFATFERNMARDAGPDAPVLVERLG